MMIFALLALTCTPTAAGAYAPVLEELQSERAAARALTEKKCLPALTYSPRAREVAVWNRAVRLVEARRDRVRAMFAGTHRCGPFSLYRYHQIPDDRLANWLCIHRGEGPWNANTGNGYYGGMQMDWSFMRAYGWGLLARKGTADKWEPWEQILVADRAYLSGRGYHPWPTTARRCGLI